MRVSSWFAFVSGVLLSGAGCGNGSQGQKPGSHFGDAGAGGSGGFLFFGTGGNTTAGSGGVGAGAAGAGAGGSGGVSNASTDAGPSIVTKHTYTNNGDQTVTDQTTGLIWMRCPVGQSGDDCAQGTATQLMWQQAIDYCSTLNFAGHDDWRSPAMHELASIVDLYDPRGDLDSTAFPGVSNNAFWSGDADLDTFDTPDSAWSIDFLESTTVQSAEAPIFSEQKVDIYPVRCVRGAPLVVGQLSTTVVAQNRLVHDQATGLTWEGCVAGTFQSDCSVGNGYNYTWRKAAEYCDTLTYGGHDDWRLPEAHELLSIVDYASAGFFDSNVFPQTPTLTWTASIDLFGSNEAWVVSFSDGTLSSDDQSDAEYGYTRCVRSGP